VDLAIVPIDDNMFEGPETLTLTLSDSGSYDVGSPASASITIADNDPPDTTITSGPATPAASDTAQFSFAGSEPVSALAGFECALDGAVFTGCVSPVSYSGLGEGVHLFTVRAVDQAGHVDPTPAAFTWTVDLAGPSITLNASVVSLWPANGKLVPDTITGRVTDALAGVDPTTVTFTVTDEYGQVQPAGAVSLGADGQFSFVILLEASRLGADHDGRRYVIAVSAADAVGHGGSASIVVVVPHDAPR